MAVAADEKTLLSRRRKPGLWPLSAVAAVVVLALAAMTVAGVGLIQGRPYTFHGLPFDPPSPAPDFALTDQDGRPVRLSDHRGKMVLLYFGFTHCRTFCPTTLATWNKVVNLLQADDEQVRFVFITVDPERDTPERLKEYLAGSNPTFIGLTGPLEEIEDVTRGYNAYFKQVDSAADYMISHTTLTHVIDQTGSLVLAFRPDAEPQNIVADLKYFLRRQGVQRDGLMPEVGPPGRPLPDRPSLREEPHGEHRG